MHVLAALLTNTLAICTIFSTSLTKVVLVSAVKKATKIIMYSATRMTYAAGVRN